MKRKLLQVSFQPHALKRLNQRLPGTRQEKIRGRLRQKIGVALRVGAPVYYGAIRVEVMPDIWCVCAPDMVGWTVITVIDRSIPRSEEVGRG